VGALAPDVEPGARLARGEQRGQRRDRAAVHDHAAGGVRQAELAAEVARERELAGGARLAQLVDRARAVGHGRDERAERRERQGRGQLVPDVGRVVSGRRLAEDALHERERVGTAREVGRPALAHGGGIARIRDRDRALGRRRQEARQAVDDGVTDDTELLGIARGVQTLAHPSAFSPVRSRPTISVWMSCVPS
jgi:hypothetical protein